MPSRHHMTFLFFLSGLSLPREPSYRLLGGSGDFSRLGSADAKLGASCTSEILNLTIRDEGSLEHFSTCEIAANLCTKPLSTLHTTSVLLE